MAKPFVIALRETATLPCGHPLSAASVEGLLRAGDDHRAQCLACQDTPAGRLARSLTVPLPAKRPA